MPTTPTHEPSRVYPTIRYQDAPAMIAWLQRAFGFELRVAYPGPEGDEHDRIDHAELAFGSGLIMLGSIREDDFAIMTGAAMTGESSRSSGDAAYLAVEDADAHYARARAAGAEILRELGDTDYGSRDFICRDPEGRVWCFGTYWPKVGEPPLPASES
jgi:uncharacterized glyoxalase superfamily protein PhnB